MSRSRASTVLAAIERCRKRLWAHCYRMTGRRTEADDLSQEAIARAIERAEGLRDFSAVEGWLFRIATTVCLDHLRRERRARGLTELVDPVVFEDLPAPASDPEATALLRDDVRLAIVAALQHLAPRQRAVLLLHDVFGLPLAEVAGTIGTNANAVKAALHRAREALVRARGRSDVDIPVDAAVVGRLAHALEARSVDDLAAILADDVWGVVDGGGVVKVATRPTFGARALLRRFANLIRRVTVPVTCEVMRLNGEPAVLVTVPTAGHAVFASVHVETRSGRIVAMRVVRDPGKLQPLHATPRRESLQRARGGASAMAVTRPQAAKRRIHSGAERKGGSPKGAGGCFRAGTPPDIAFKDRRSRRSGPVSSGC